MGITIRRALPEDAYDYTICHISIWQSAYKGIVPDSYLENMSAETEQRADRYRKALAEPGDCDYFCVINAKRMVGFIIIEKNLAEIWAIYLIEELWGKGYGKEMLDFAVNELKLMEPKEIFLWVFEQNNRARRFYERNNFSFSGTKREVDRYGGVPLVQLKYVYNF